jgi:hypothetical protein
MGCHIDEVFLDGLDIQAFQAITKAGEDVFIAFFRREGKAKNLWLPFYAEHHLTISIELCIFDRHSPQRMLRFPQVYYMLLPGQFPTATFYLFTIDNCAGLRFLVGNEDFRSFLRFRLNAMGQRGANNL